MLRRLKSFVGVALTSGLVLIMSAVGALPVAAAQGDIWTQPGGIAEETHGHSQEVHLPCGNVDIWGDKLDSSSGSWVLYHQPPPNPPGHGTVITKGTFAYRGDGSHLIATIPRSVFQSAVGRHFKIEVDNKKSKTFWVDCALALPTLTTAPNPTSAIVGATLNDTANLGGGSSPTGTITFTLYNPSNVAVHTETVNVTGNRIYSTPTGHVANVAGTWHWSAAYSGDANNKAVHSLMADEPVVVTQEQHQAQPSISTAPDPTSATVGSTLKDSATLSGGQSPTGTITFTLYYPNNASAYTETATVSGNGPYSTVHGFAANTVGTWHWSAAYSGDANNKAVHSLMADEPVVVTGEQHQAQPSISTAPNPTSAIVGSTLNDTATLSDGNHPTGTITFTLFDPSDKSAYTEEVAVSGNGPYSTATGHIADMVGTWHWSAAYSGDQGNKAVHSLMADEPVVVNQAPPSITTSPNPTSAIVGATLKDTATLSGGYHPTGTITFTLYDPNNASAYTETATVSGNGSYSTATGHVANVAGTWHWSAAYSGDANNKAVHSQMANEPVTINATGGVLAATGGVLAATGSTPLAELLALFLVGFGALAIMTAVVWRRRRVA
jgi:hypothetical protein